MHDYFNNKSLTRLKH